MERHSGIFTGDSRENIRNLKTKQLSLIMARGGYIYIVSNTSRTVLYIGVTSNLHNRAYAHKHGEGSIFTSRYKCTDLLYFEFFPTIMEAIQREKKLKKWKRVWKEELIKSINPNFDDLFDQISELQ